MWSRSPTAGGQYHWVSILAPRSSQKVLSFLTGTRALCQIIVQAKLTVLGWLTVVGWQANVAASAYVAGTLIQGLIALVDPTYKSKIWHTTLLMYGTLALSVLIITVMSTVLHNIEILLLVIYILGFVGVLVPLVYLGPHANAYDIFTTFKNNGGWSSQGLSFFVGISVNAFAFLGNIFSDLTYVFC